MPESKEMIKKTMKRVCQRSQEPAGAVGAIKEVTQHWALTQSVEYPRIHTDTDG